MKEKLGISVLFLLFASFLLWGNQSPLYDQDEAAYAGFAKTMLVSGDYLTQEFPYSNPHRKPPLHFYLSAISFRVLGISEFSLRLFPSFFVFGTCLLTYLFSYRFFGKRSALYAFCLLAFSLYLPINGKVALVDAGLLFWETLGIFSLLSFLTSQSPRDRILFWISISLGVLQKGPPILIFLGGTCFLLLFSKTYRRQIWALWPWVGLPLSLVPIFIWGFLVWEKTDGALIRWMLDWYILKRTTSSVFGQSGPPGTYLVWILLAIFPWTYWGILWVSSTLRTFYKTLKAKFQKQTYVMNSDRISKLLLLSLVFAWFFYEILPSKLPSYPLAAFPILSLLIGNWADQRFSSQKEFRIQLGLGILIWFFLLLFGLPWANEKRKDTSRIANQLRSFVSQDSPIYSYGALGIPSLAFYCDCQIQEIPWEDLVKVPSPLLTSEKDALWIRSVFPNKFETLALGEVFLYDRAKRIRLVLLEAVQSKKR